MRTQIIGGGIAGLATSIRLKHHGFDATIYEKSSLETHSGMGFILLNNGIQALEELGVIDRIHSFATKLNYAQIFNSDGMLLSEKQLFECYGASRTKFVQMLRQETGSDRIRTKMVFSHLEGGESREGELYRGLEHFRAAHFENGEQVSGDLFVGADGVRSRMRNVLFPHSLLSPVRVKELVSIVCSKELYEWIENRFVKIVHESGGLALGIVPCAKNEIVWFLQFDSNKWNLEPENQGSRSLIDPVKILVKDWPEPVTQLLEQTDFTCSHVWRTTDLCSLPSYHRGNSVLLGDAAHAQLTFTSQGVNCALEDAVLLGDLIAYTGSDRRFLPAAFGQFYDARSEAMHRYQSVGRELLARFLLPVKESDFSIPLAQNEVGRI